MREIKFRYKDVTPQGLRYVYSEHFGSLAHFFSYILETLEDNLEQYTGLQDKDGVDIYVGDIVTDGQSCQPLVAVVEFKNGKFGVHHVKTRLTGTVVCRHHAFDLNVRLTVIGNIYQTPELLNNLLQP